MLPSHVGQGRTYYAEALVGVSEVLAFLFATMGLLTFETQGDAEHEKISPLELPNLRSEENTKLLLVHMCAGTE